MNILEGFIDCWSMKFDSARYPPEFYLSNIEDIQKSTSPIGLSSLIENMLCWKDGKVRKKSSGILCVGGVMYSKGQPKPNTYDPKRHGQILQKACFFNWAKKVMQIDSFNSEVVLQVTSELKLWSNKSIVLPSFLAHILNPRIFPLYDQHVERSYRFFSGLPLNSDSTNLSICNYKEYHIFWCQLLSDLHVKHGTTSIEHLKKIDNALWTIGKYLKIASVNQPLNGSFEYSPITEISLLHEYNTSSPKFINLVLRYCNTGSETQRDAMLRASKELNINLPNSYLKYPGSHIYRWRKQGFPNNY